MTLSGPVVAPPMAQGEKFVRKFGLWSDDQHRQAAAIKERVRQEDIRLFRVAWADPHGVSRAKTLTRTAFMGALESGYNINVATTTLDAAGGRVFSSFTRGGGMGLEEMTGSPNLIAVPDPGTFRVLPWEPNVGWILCDEYFTNGTPFHFSPRQLLRKQLDRLSERKLRSVIGLEIEFYLVKLAEEHLTSENVGSPGIKGRAPLTYPVEPGFSFHSESNMDRIHKPVAALAEHLERLGLPLRSIEKEWGPGQLECTFAPTDALEAADNVILFRAATRQICRRMGYLATFMTRPRLPGFYSSGWHLHQSLIDASDGRNVLTPTTDGQVLSTLGRSYLGGLMHHALSSTLFANPTINGYRRFRANSLAPDRVAWCTDHRGVMLRVLGGLNDPASRIENRIGEPSANPYLYIVSQIISGLDGIDNHRDPGPPDTDPYATKHPMLPKSLSDALALMAEEPLYRESLGGTFVDYYLKLKQAEIGRFEKFAADNKIDPLSDDTTVWEQDEYFDFF
jgi:glutamine synthetase